MVNRENCHTVVNDESSPVTGQVVKCAILQNFQSGGNHKWVV